MNRKFVIIFYVIIFFVKEIFDELKSSCIWLKHVSNFFFVFNDEKRIKFEFYRFSYTRTNGAVGCNDRSASQKDK